MTPGAKLRPGVVELWTDGSCPKPDGPGGWAALLRAVDRHGELHEELLVGGLHPTTNNRAEMTAVLEGLRGLKRRAVVHVYTDSRYVMDAFTQGWITKWKANGWRKKATVPYPGHGLFTTPEFDDHAPHPRAVRNADLWVALDAEVAKHDVRFTHVKGHSGVPLNERVDRAAGEQTRLMRQTLAVR